MTIQDAKTVSGKIEKEAVIKKNKLNYLLNRNKINGERKHTSPIFDDR